MEALICKNCGAAINPSTMKCEYCGTQYKRDHEQIIKVETYQNPCKVYKTQMMIPEEEIKHLGEEEIAKIAINTLSRNLAEAIKPNMEIHQEYDPMNMHQVITARVRIVEPKYVF